MACVTCSRRRSRSSSRPSPCCGYRSVEQYAEYLIPTFVYGACHFGAHAERTPYIVRDKFEFHHRKADLFTRYRFLSVARQGDEYRILANLSDSYHEMQVHLAVSPGDWEITEASAEMIRVPDRVCPSATEVFSRVVGLTPDARGQEGASPGRWLGRRLYPPGRPGGGDREGIACAVDAGQTRSSLADPWRQGWPVSRVRHSRGLGRHTASCRCMMQQGS